MNKLLEKAKPILFNTDMVQAILDGRKTETRRLIKPQPKHVQALTDGRFETSEDGGFDQDVKYIKPPYQKGDMLYVRETWCPFVPEHIIDGVKYAYKASTASEGERCRQDYMAAGFPYKWRPSIHMPKKAARIFLRVTDVRVERLQDINHNGIQNEGCLPAKIYGGELEVLLRNYWVPLWDSINKSRGYGWDANPWVWVIQFERMEGQADV